MVAVLITDTCITEDIKVCVDIINLLSLFLHRNHIKSFASVLYMCQTTVIFFNILALVKHIGSSVPIVTLPPIGCVVEHLNSL